jgi:hypothetical protein
MSGNGRMLASELAPIGGGYFLRKDAAAAFNAMSKEANRRWGKTISVISAYRTYATQVYLWDHVAHAHDTNWVAVPGTSNHGWGLAVDLATQWGRWAVDQIGKTYGFNKICSDAPVEWWHIKFNPACTHATWRATVSSKPRTLKLGMRGDDVKEVQIYLLRGGYLRKGDPARKIPPAIDGNFGPGTRAAVMKFQSGNKLASDGLVGPATISALRRKYKK